MDNQNNEWFIHLNNNTYGPFCKLDIFKLIKSGQITERSFVFHESLGDWRQINRLPDFVHYFEKAHNLDDVPKLPCDTDVPFQTELQPKPQECTQVQAPLSTDKPSQSKILPESDSLHDVPSKTDEEIAQILAEPDNTQKNDITFKEDVPDLPPPLPSEDLTQTSSQPQQSSIEKAQVGDIKIPTIPTEKEFPKIPEEMDIIHNAEPPLNPEFDQRQLKKQNSQKEESSFKNVESLLSVLRKKLNHRLKTK